MRDFTERQQQIIKAAIKLISEGGFENLSIRKLANLVGISEPAIYRHFKNKSDILLNVGAFTRRNFFQGTRFMEFIEGLPGIDAIEEFQRNFTKLASENKDIAEALYCLKTSRKYAHLLEAEAARNPPILDIIAGLMKRGQDEGNIRDDIPGEMLMVIFEGAFGRVLEKWYLLERDFDLVAEWESVWQTLRKMIEVPE